MRFALTGLYLVSVKKIFSILERAHGDDCAQDLMDRGVISCTATDAHDVVHRVPRHVWNEWGISLLKEEL